MKYYNLFFSPTGGTRKITYALMDGFGEKFINVDLISDKNYDQLKFEEDDFCIIAVPSYGGRVPGPASKILHDLNGNGARAALVVSYGNRAIDDTLCELSDILENAGFQCIAGIEAVAEHSLARKIAEGRPDTKDGDDLRRYAQEIKNALETKTHSRAITFPGSRPYVEYNGVPIKPKTSNKCNNCGHCAEECPAHAIPKSDPRLTNKEKCISCMHCVYICPVHARKVPQIMEKAVETKLKKVCSGRKPNKLYI